jgi:hypothetical protein
VAAAVARRDAGRDIDDAAMVAVALAALGGRSHEQALATLRAASAPVR